MPYFLFTFHREWCCSSPWGWRRHTWRSRTVESAVRWGTWPRESPLRAHLLRRDRLEHSSRDPAPPEDGLLSHLKDADCGRGPRGLLVDAALLSHLVATCRGWGRTLICAVGIGLASPSLSRWQCLSSPCLLMEAHVGFSWGVMSCFACLCSRERTRNGKCGGCWGLGSAAHRPGASTLITFYFGFCILAILNCKTNMSTVQYLY